MFMVGTHIAWISLAINKLKSGEDGLTANDEQVSLIASIPDMGRFFGPLLTVLTLDKLGRKPTAFICSFSMFISWLIMYFARSIEIIYFVRLLFGVTYGAVDVTNAIYVAENCTPKMRGLMSSIFPIFYSTAHIIEYVLLAYKSFSFVAAVNTVIGFFALLTSFFLKETPYYLMMKGRIEEAKQNLLWLRGRNVIDEDTKFEIDQIQQNMQLEVSKKRSLVLMFGSPENYKSLLMSLTFNILIQAMGMQSVVAYCSIILQSSSIFSVKEFTIMLGVFQLISACISPFIIERYNRRTLLLKCLRFMGISQIGLFFLYWMKMSIPNECFSWLVFVAVTCCYCSFALCYSVIIILRSELLPMSVRAIGGCLNIMTTSFGSTICITLFLPMADTIGIEYNFLFFFIGCIVLYIFVLRVLHETRGKTLVDIQMSFQQNK